MAKLKMKNPIVTRLMISETNKKMHEFAKDIGISQPYLSQILNEKRNPSPTIGHKIATGLGLKIEDIFFTQIDNNCNQFEKERKLHNDLF